MFGFALPNSQSFDSVSAFRSNSFAHVYQRRCQIRPNNLELQAIILCRKFGTLRALTRYGVVFSFNPDKPELIRKCF
jgi:hypothetical protein